jgi:D-alanyl-D-alanine carboxypeptidase/D-alanyl-D-alanine-endopeptidase (penicillin-binding protein 4)
MRISQLYITGILIILLSGCVSSKKLNRQVIQTLTEDTLLKTAHVGIAIWNTNNDRFILQHNSKKYFVPASNVKIATLYTALKYLPDTLPSFDYYNTPDTLFIIPKGNPAFLHPEFKDLYDFAFLKNIRKPIVLLPVSWETEIYGKGWAWDDHQSSYMPKRSPMPVQKKEIINAGVDAAIVFPSLQHQYESAAQRLSDTLGMPVLVSKNVKVFNEKPLTLLAASRDSVCKKMMFDSDNLIAEQFLLMMSDRMLGIMNEMKLIEKILSDSTLSFPQKPVWVDGSGLSRYNLFTPEDMVFLLKKIEKDFGDDRIKTLFPTGNEGTLKGTYDDKAGFVYAKTGTLSGQMSLSGYLRTKRNTPLIFSIMINNHTGKSTQVRKLITAYVDRIWRKY